MAESVSDSLRPGWSGNRIPVKAKFSAHPVFCRIGTVFFPGRKQAGRGADHSPPLVQGCEWF
jgi:hypothetical protein